MNILVDGQTLETPEINRGIGVYFKNVLNNMIKQSYEHNWYILISDTKSLDSLDKWVRSQIIPICDKAFAPGTDYARSEVYTKKVNEIVKWKKIDCFWIANPLMVNVLFPIGEINCSVYATIYDLIPAIMPIKDWPKEIKNEYDRRLEYFKLNKIFKLYISDATKRDFEKYIVKDDFGKSILLAANSKLFLNTEKNKPRETNIVFTGGFDYRKNIDGAIDAFIKLNEKYSTDEIVKKAKFYIVCRYNEADKAKLVEKLKKKGLDNKVIFTGFVSDLELAELYANALVFFFPSLYEGFGLPILEAMLGGAYVLSADNSSLPEICAGHALLCNASDKEDMVDKLYASLHNADEEGIDARESRKKYALTYSWEKTAQETLMEFENSENIAVNEKSKKKIAIITPWPEQQTGIANFVYKTLPYLAKYYDIDIFVDNTEEKKAHYKKNEFGNLYMISELDERHKDYAQLLYQMGNNSMYHKGIYEMLEKYPGIVEIHDYVLQPFFYHSYFLQKKYDIYKNAIELGYGKDGTVHYENLRKKLEAPDNVHFPMSHSIVKHSTKAIFHNKWSANQMSNEDKVYVIPLPAIESAKIEKEQQQKLEHYQLHYEIDLELLID